MIKYLFNKIINKFNIIELDYSKNLKQIDYKKLFDKKIDVLIVRNFLNKEEIKTAQSIINKIPKDEFIWHDERYKSIPPVFEYINKMNNLNDYFSLCRNKGTILNQIFGVFSLENKCIELFSNIFGKSKENIRRFTLNSTISNPFPSGCLRIIPPQYGEIKIHADNNFYPNNSRIHNDFTSVIDLSNHISYILTIQGAEKGGNLVLYDIDQFEYDQLSKDGKAVLKKDTKKEHLIDSFLTKEIIANDGDLVLFSGGRIWHSVNKMKGEKERITYGGFSALGKDKQTIYLWT